MLVDNIKQLISESFGETEYKQPPNSDSKEIDNIDFDIQFNESDNTITYTTVLGDAITEDATIYELASLGQMSKAKMFGVGFGVAALGAIGTAASLNFDKIKSFVTGLGASGQDADTISNSVNSAAQKLNSINDVNSGTYDLLKKTGASDSDIDALVKSAGPALDKSFNAASEASASAYEEITTASSVVTSDESRTILQKFSESIKSAVSQLDGLRTYFHRTLDAIKNSPEDYRNIVIKFFQKYQSSPIAQQILQLSETNPIVFMTLIVALPIVAVGGAVGGVYLVAKSIKSSSDAQKAIKTRETELAKTTNPKRRKEIQSEIGIIGAKALMLGK